MRRRLLVLGMLGLAVGGLPRLQAVRADTPDANDDLVCGPRYVQQVLKHFGQEADLIELARETQWPDLEAGATLESLDQALRKRGIHTSAIRIPPGTTLLWPHPAIVHMRPKPGSTLGHYVVWLPSSTSDRVDVWVALGRVEYVPAAKFWDGSSRSVVITATAPLDDPNAAVTRSTASTAWTPCLCILVTAVVIGACLRVEGCRDVRVST